MENFYYFKMNPPKSWWRPVLVVILMFVLLGGISTILFSSILALVTHENLTKITSDSLSSSLGSLYAFGFVLLGIIYWNRKIDHRPLQALGFVKDKLVSRYSLGFVLGAGALNLLALLVILTGSLHFQLHQNIEFGLLFAFLFGFMIQGLTEEVLCRGYLQGSLSAVIGEKWAVLLSAVVFAILHGANPGIQLIPLINLFVFGLVFALIYLYSKNILFVGAIHSAWNFFQGPVFGVKVSGMKPMTSILDASYVKADFINGGSFRIEGSLYTTILGLIICLGLCRLIFKAK